MPHELLSPGIEMSLQEWEKHTANWGDSEWDEFFGSDFGEEPPIDTSSVVYFEKDRELLTTKAAEALVVAG